MGLKRRTSLYSNFNKILMQDWVHEEILIQDGIGGDITDEN